MVKTYHNPEPFQSAQRPYAMAVKAGQLVFLAGQLGVEFSSGERRVVAPDDAPAQLAQIFENMKIVLADVGCTIDDVCWIQIFVTDMTDRLRMDAVRRQYFGECLPAATMVEVARLALPGAVVEVNAIAMARDEARSVDRS